jgi:hypothetical protein
MKSGIPLLLADAQVDPSFAASKSVVRSGIQSAMCAPFGNRDRRFGGFRTREMILNLLLRFRDQVVVIISSVYGKKAQSSAIILNCGFNFCNCSSACASPRCTHSVN